MHHSKGLQVTIYFLRKITVAIRTYSENFALTESGLFDKFVPGKISQVTSSLNVSTRLSILDTQESILET